MTDYPCLADTESVALAIDGNTLVPTLRLDDDPTNALELRSSGLYAPTSVMASTRIYNTGSQAVNNNNTIQFPAMRWQYNNSSWSANTLIMPLPGLWLIGASVAFDLGATAGVVTCTIQTNLGQQIAADTCSSWGANGFFTASPEEVCCNPSGAAYLSGGALVTVTCQHSFAGTIPTVIVEAAGAELWCCLLRPGGP